MSTTSLPDRLHQLAELVAILDVAGIGSIVVSASSGNGTILLSGWPVMDGLQAASAVFAGTGIEWTPSTHFWTARLVCPVEGVDIEAHVSPRDVPESVRAQLYPVPVAASVTVPL